MSPHLAAEREGFVVKDSVVLETLRRCFRDVVESGVGKERSEVMCIVETAGGVASPGPSGSLQCDLYRCEFQPFLSFCLNTCRFSFDETIFRSMYLVRCLKFC